MRRRTMLLAAVCLLAVAAAAAAVLAQSSSHPRPPAAFRPVSGQLVGVTFGGPVFDAPVNLDRQLDAAVASGAESLRVAVNWASLQPYRTVAEVPRADRPLFTNAGGVPTRFGELDRLIGAAAQRRLSVLPVVEYTPRWDAEQPGDPASAPKAPAPYAALLSALIGRYGPNGTFWQANPRIRAVPIRMWQIWNEPNFSSYWSEQPFAASYVRLLTAAHAAIKAADPQAEVVLAGFADFSWKYLEEVYRVSGASRLFDIVAIHPYTSRPSGVIEILRRARAVMDRYRDAGKPILATEITWPSSQGKAPPQFGVSTTESEQAADLGQLMPLLLANRSRLGLLGFYWYTWMGDETPRPAPYAFDYAGLVKYAGGSVTPKPALAVFKRWALSIEGCASKTSAVSCGS